MGVAFNPNCEESSLCIVRKALVFLPVEKGVRKFLLCYEMHIAPSALQISPAQHALTLPEFTIISVFGCDAPSFFIFLNHYWFFALHT